MDETNATYWHDTYQQHANSVDEFLGELLDLLPGATHTGSDAYDQIPRAIKALSAERDKALGGVPLICCDERHAAKVQGLTAERDALKAAIADIRADCIKQASRKLDGGWSQGVCTQARRTLSIISAARLDAPTPTEETDRG